jgi:hypothetical protein
VLQRATTTWGFGEGIPRLTVSDCNVPVQDAT